MLFLKGKFSNKELVGDAEQEQIEAISLEESNRAYRYR